MDDPNCGHVYYRPQSGAMRRICVSGPGAVFRYSSDGPGPQEPSPPQSGPANLSGRVTPLYDQCLAFLARFTHCFDSLEDFPADFGTAIFRLALDRLTVDGRDTLRSLTTFSLAYPSLLLPSCRLQHSLLLLNQYEVSLPGLLAATASLDLSHCGLHDSHDLLQQLAQLSSLQVLCLAHNQLGDSGLSRLLLPRALTSLRYLDWSGNSLNLKSIHRLRQTPQLTSLVLLERDLLPPASLLLAPALQGGFRRLACPRLETVNTNGFGLQLLEAWTEASKPKQPKPKSSFYAQRVLKPISNKNALREGNKVMFEKFTKVPDVKTSKRKVEASELQRTKMQKLASDKGNDYEQNLLNLYM